MLYGNHYGFEDLSGNYGFDEFENKFENFSADPSSVDKTVFSDSVVGLFTFLKLTSLDPKKQSIDDFVTKYAQYSGYEKKYDNEYAQNIANVYSFMKRKYGSKRLIDASNLLATGSVEKRLVDFFMEEGFIKNHPADQSLAYNGVLTGYPAYRILKVFDDVTKF